MNLANPVNLENPVVVPQAAEFTYILFTQEINTRDTSGQHGLSDLSKRYFRWWLFHGTERNGTERNGTELRSKIRNGTGLTERSWMSCTAQKKVAEHYTMYTM